MTLMDADPAGQARRDVLAAEVRAMVALFACVVARVDFFFIRKRNHLVSPWLSI